MIRCPKCLKEAGVDFDFDFDICPFCKCELDIVHVSDLPYELPDEEHDESNPLENQK